MPYFILALTFGAMGLSLREYLTPDRSTHIRLSIDLIWLPLLGFWLITFWNTTLKPNQTFSRLKIFLITPVLATLTLGLTQLNWGLKADLLVSKSAMLTEVRSIKGEGGKRTIGLFHFSEYRIKRDCSLFTLTTPSEGAHTGFYHSATPRAENDILKEVVSGLVAESYIIPMGENWSYWYITYKYTGF